MFYPYPPEPPRYVGPVLAPEFGWRYWAWSPSRQILCSPMYRAVWRTGELRALNWYAREQVSAMRNHAGIHAVLAPVEWWDAEDSEIIPSGDPVKGYSCSVEEGIGERADWTSDEISITGLVERFGRYLLGERGWRAEIVFIRELLAPNTEIGLQLEEAFPDIRVRYRET
jgi:hypothetical protein